MEQGPGDINGSNEFNIPGGLRELRDYLREKFKITPKSKIRIVNKDGASLDVDTPDTTTPPATPPKP